MPKWVRVGSTTGTQYADLDKAVNVGALEDPNNAGSYVIAVWLIAAGSSSDFQVLEGSHTTLAAAEVALQELVQGYDPSA